MTEWSGGFCKFTQTGQFCHCLYLENFRNRYFWRLLSNRPDFLRASETYPRINFVCGSCRKRIKRKSFRFSRGSLWLVVGAPIVTSSISAAAFTLSIMMSFTSHLFDEEEMVWEDCGFDNGMPACGTFFMWWMNAVLSFCVFLFARTCVWWVLRYVKLAAPTPCRPLAPVFYGYIMHRIDFALINRRFE